MTIELDLIIIRQVLDAKRKELERRRSKREDILIETTADELDRMQQTVNREVAIRNIDRDSNQLKEVVAAIERLSDETYGACLRCEKSIPENRLRAVPWAACCVACQELLDCTRRRGQEDADDVAA